MWITLIFLLFGILSVCYTKQPVTASRVTYLWCKEEETAEVVNSSFFVSVQHFVPRLVEFCELNEVVSLVMHSVTALSALRCYRSALAPAANVGLSWRRGLNVPPASLIGWCRTLHESSTQAAVVTRCDHPSGPRIGDPNASCGVAAHSNHTHTHTHACPIDTEWPRVTHSTRICRPVSWSDLSRRCATTSIHCSSRCKLSVSWISECLILHTRRYPTGTRICCCLIFTGWCIDLLLFWRIILWSGKVNAQPSALDVCWRRIYLHCTEAFSALEMF